jgi:uncharacterized repeat protein (TIGR04138 family)
MSIHYRRLEELVQRDPRFAYEAYAFVFEALAHTQVLLGRRPEDESEGTQHVSGPQLLDGIRDLALREFGLMARTVFRMWGIEKTGDFGAIVFNLIEANLMSKTDSDSPLDFEDVYDLDQVLIHDYRIEVASEVD